MNQVKQLFEAINYQIDSAITDDSYTSVISVNDSWDLSFRYDKDLNLLSAELYESLSELTFIYEQGIETSLEAILNVIRGPMTDITIELKNNELLDLMKLAHKRDITFNQLVVQALENVVHE
jgi:hypothetical protein